VHNLYNDVTVVNFEDVSRALYRIQSGLKKTVSNATLKQSCRRLTKYYSQ